MKTLEERRAYEKNWYKTSDKTNVGLLSVLVKQLFYGTSNMKALFPNRVIQKCILLFFWSILGLECLCSKLARIRKGNLHAVYRRIKKMITQKSSSMSHQSLIVNG